MGLFRDRVALLVVAVSTALAIAAAPALATDPSGAARVALTSLLDTIPSAPQSSFGTLDSSGRPVGTIKIIANPGGRGYIGVYHVSDASGTFYTRVGTSTDLTHWSYKAQLASNASQPTIAALSDGGFLVALEKYVPSFLGLGLNPATSHVELLFYSSYANLLAGSAAQTFDAPDSLSNMYEGTPSIGATTIGLPSPGFLGLFAGAPLSNSQIDVGFHWYDSSAGVDRQGTAVLTNFSNWSAQVNTPLDSAFAPFAPGGNIGGRDYVSFEGYPFTVVEAQSRKNDFSSWRVYLYDDTAGILSRLTPHTPGASVSFGNPKVTVLTDPAGNRALAASLFVFSTSNNAPGEYGPLIYYDDF
jgi:hypothetical protein